MCAQSNYRSLCVCLSLYLYTECFVRQLTHLLRSNCYRTKRRTVANASNQQQQQQLTAATTTPTAAATTKAITLCRKRQKLPTRHSQSQLTCLQCVCASVSVSVCVCVYLVQVLTAAAVVAAGNFYQRRRLRQCDKLLGVRLSVCVCV